MEEIEIELTYLVKELPEGLKECPHKVLLDIYIPSTHPHPNLRLRQKGDSFEITNKTLLNAHDSSAQRELTIALSAEEFSELSSVPGKRVKKIRYYYPYNGLTAEIDVFQDGLAGLVLADFEFKSSAEKDAFSMPEWCLVDVTQEEFIAGGMLCGKTYKDIEERLAKFAYKKL